jgi:uncharacterized cupredoxin-like copper-binding protein
MTMKRTRAGLTIFALLAALLGGSFLLAGTSSLAQEASPPRPSHIHTGDCDELGEIIQPLTSLTVPAGTVRGNSDAVVAEAAFTNIPQTLDELLATDHALKVHLSKDQIQIYLACGDIGGTVDANGALIVGLKELDNSGYTGIAYLAPAANGGTDVSVMIAQVLPGGGIERAAATPATAQAAAEPAVAEPAVVDVGLTEFAIDVPASLPAGATRFHITNNGTVTHGFVLEGEGVSKTLANNLAPGQSAFLNADLTPGTYTISCPVGAGAHRAQGMEVKLTVS